MRLFKAAYRDRHGNKCKSQKWYIDFSDNQQIRRRIPAFTNRDQSEALGKKVEKLVVCKLNTESPDRELSEWLAHIPQRLRIKLAKIGLLDKRRVAAGKTLSRHLEDFRKSLEVGNTPTYAKTTYSRVRRVFDTCGFVYWSDISASEVKQTISKFRKTVQTVSIIDGNKVKDSKDLGEISTKSKNYYLQAVQQFCRWMVLDRRASESPVEHLDRLEIPETEHRRALNFDEVRSLLVATEKAPTRFGMTGHDRAVLYLLAAETGLRVRELQSLTVSSFDFEKGTVTAKAKYCKNRRTAEQLLKNKRASQLQEFFANKMPKASAFDMPSNYRTAAMLKADLKEAKIPYEDEAGRKADFHCIRHSLATALDQTGASLKERMAIMRHSCRSNLTLGTYSHVRIFDIQRAIENLPDYPWPGTIQSEQAKATGTYDADLTPSVFAKCLAKSHGENQNLPERAGEVTPDSDVKTAFLNGPGRIRTYDQWIMSPLLYR